MTYFDVAVGPAPFLGGSRLSTNASMVYAMFNNVAWYYNATVDNLWQQYVAETDQQERYDILKEIQMGFTYDAAYISVAEKPIILVYRNDRFPTLTRFPKGIGIPAEWYTQMGTIWWSGGSPYSPWECEAAISAAQAKIDESKTKGYDVSRAESKLNEAQNALDQGDYTTAKTQADIAPSLVGTPPTEAPPYMLWTAILIVGVIAVVAVEIVYVRKGRRAKDEKLKS